MVIPLCLTKIVCWHVHYHILVFECYTKTPCICRIFQIFDEKVKRDKKDLTVVETGGLQRNIQRDTGFYVKPLKGEKKDKNLYNTGCHGR